ncbi:DUF748 domain-containing protein [Opitutus terrae]|uniref:DUF748 domain-containing protein n=1 Tax=Opitutus terrae (strain DSM 11246 / JCM 15787 / PB90-1) TaxID=452637 RepID=B1ZZF4_OPITP|nr:DUF748 domain-containing protein [Opitutus terrae]ACB76357.1 protein of unknown function DUF748 [Opitutus terrae PB90-1]
MKQAFVTRRRAALAAALLVLFTVVGFFVLPPLIRPQLEKRLSQELGRRVTIEKLRLNPYTLSVTLENFAIMEPDGVTRFLGWQRLYVNFDALSSLWGSWVLGDIELDRFDARVVLQADGTFSFADLLKRFTPTTPAPTPSEPARPIRIARLKVTETSVNFSDLSRAQPFTTTVGPLTFALTEFKTVSQRGAPYRFEAVTESGEKLSWAGTLQAEPMRSAGELSLEGIVLPKYAPYYADLTQADLTSGRLSVRGRYELDLTPGQHVMKLHEGMLQLHEVKVVQRSDRSAVLDLPAFEISGVDADALSQKATIAAIVLNGGKVSVRREKSGAINLLAMLQPAAPKGGSVAVAAPPAATPANAGAAPKLPDVTIEALTVKGLQVELTDEAPPRPAQLSLSGLDVSLKEISLAAGARMPLHLAFNWAPQGTVQLDGAVGLNPVTAELKANVTGLALLPLSPYLEQFANAHITQGALTTTLSAEVELTPDAAPAARVSGDVTLEKFSLVDAVLNEDLAGVGSVALRGLRASTAPELQVALDEIVVTAPYARVLVAKDQKLNLASLAVAPAAAAEANAESSPPAAPTVAAAAPAPLPKVDIAKVTIADGDFRFTDRSLEPNVSVAVSQFGGTITGLSASNPAKADVNLKAVVDGSGPVAITGKLDPLSARPTVDLTVDMKNVDLLPLSPYAGKYAGYELARGKLLVDVKLLVDGKKIDAANVVTLNQFTFGNAVQSPDATSLPVRLGVALLKDLDGKIVIDIPVQGSTDDPNFRIGRVVLRVIVNLLTKAAVSPFSLLGAAFGGGGDELAFQEFVPGSTELQPSEVAKLETMTKALVNRPGLSLDLDGSYDAAADGYALKRVKLADQIRRAAWEQKRRSDSNLPPPDQFVPTADEETAVVKKLFDEKFPPGTQFGTPLPPPPEVVAPPPAPAGWFKRAWRAVTFQSRREQRAAQRENEQRAADHAQAVASATAAGLPLDEMKGRLAEAITVDENELGQLAQARAQRVRDYFMTTGQISADRLFLAKEKEQTVAPKEGKGPRVFLTLQ